MIKKIYLSIIILLSCVPNAFADESYYWVNPIYEHLLSDLPSQKTSRESIGTTQCLSYEELKDALKKNFEERVTEFKIHLKYDFSFDDVNSISTQAFNEVLDADDYLRYHILSWKIDLQGNDGNVDIDYTVTYLTSYEEEQSVSQRVTEILNEIITDEMNDEEKEKAVHDWIVMNVQYDATAKYYSAYNALFLGTAVCQGYSTLAYKMLMQVNIETRIIKGTNNGQAHGWNMVKLCGNWYHLDVTLDDPLPDVPGRVLYTYFNKSDDEIKADHIWDKEEEKSPEAPITYKEGVCSGQIPETELTVSADSCNFSIIAIGANSEPQKITLSNTGDTDIEIGNISLTGADISDFYIENDTCSVKTITPSESCTIDLIFSPQSEGVKKAVLEIPYDNSEKIDISLSGVGADPDTEPGWMKIRGTVQYNEMPLCAMILANGQYIFSCGENEGKYELKVPLDENGKITLFAFCDGLAPFKQIMYPSEAADFNITMLTAPAESKGINIEATLTTDDSGWVKIRGTVQYEDTPLCAMVLANGQYMFSCNENNGVYDMKVPLDANKQITFFCFCDGFLPFKRVLDLSK